MDEKKQKGTLKENKVPEEKQGHKKNTAENNEGHKNDELTSLVKKLVTEAVNEAKSEWSKSLEERISAEREDAARLASMTDEEREKAEMEKSRKEFEDEKAQYVSERAEFDAAKELAAENLPVAFAGMVADADKDKMLSNISAFKTEYLKAIEAGLSDRLRGTLPAVSREREFVNDPFLNGLNI